MQYKTSLFTFINFFDGLPKYLIGLFVGVFIGRKKKLWNKPKES